MTTFKERCLAAYESQQQQKREEEDQHRQQQARVARAKFKYHFGLDIPDDWINGNIVTLDEMVLRYRNQAWSLGGICPECGNQAWSRGFISLEGLGAMLVDFKPDYSEHYCEKKPGDEPRVGDTWQERLVQAIIDAVIIESRDE